MLVTLGLNCLLASTGYLTLGILVAWPATALPSIRDSLDYPLSLEAQSWIGSTANIGAVLGTICSRFFSKHIGARQGLALCGATTVTAWVFIFISSMFSLHLVYPGLLLLGWSCGLSNPLSSIYVSEIAGGGNKGMVTSIFNFNVIFGISLANILGALAGWFYSSLMMLLLHALLFCALFTLISSPYEQARADDQDKMVEILVKLRNMPAEDVMDEASLITKEVEDEKARRNDNMLETINRIYNSNFKNLGIVLVVFSMSHLSGITVITTFLVDIFSKTGISDIVLVLVTSFSEIVFSFFQMMVADKLGRKTFLVLSGIGSSIATSAFAAVFWKIENSETKLMVLGSPILDNILISNIFLVSCMVIYYLSFNIGFGPVKHTLLSEMFTPNEQETIVGLCHTVYWVESFIFTKVFLMMVENFGLIAIFIIISIICMLSVIFTITVVPETRRETL